MANKVIPIGVAPGTKPLPAPRFTGGAPVDTLGRSMHDLRISVTDRCNFRCVYCMPREVFDSSYRFLPHSAILSFEEIQRLARVFVDLGVKKIRLTGGEPLVRRDLPRLIALLAELDVEITLTTNGSLLARNARALKDAGLDRVTVSLDSLDDRTFRAMNDADFPVAKVIEGIEAAADAGLGPVKINMVVKRGTNDGDIVAMAERWRYLDGAGEVGVISSVTQAFCSTCTRMRLSTEGSLFTCLFAQSGHDLKSLLRGGASDEAIRDEIAAVWQRRTDRYSEVRTNETQKLRKVEMSYIGG